jgi:hypothetical protein
MRYSEKVTAPWLLKRQPNAPAHLLKEPISHRPSFFTRMRKHLENARNSSQGGADIA